MHVRRCRIVAVPNSTFTLYFLGYDNGGDSVAKGTQFAREGECSLAGYFTLHQAYIDILIAVLELTHNHGTETDESFQGYASGNTEPGRGFGHIAITVPDINAASERFESLGVNFKKRLTEGTMKNSRYCIL